MAEGGGISGLLALFSDIDSLDVPHFQRNYSWGESQIDAFHKDIMYATRTKSDHFIGSTILMRDLANESDKVRQIIDGQQRITTIFLYLCVLRDKLFDFENMQIKNSNGVGATIDVLGRVNNMIYSNPETGEPRFKSNEQLRPFLNEYIFPEPSSHRPDIPPRHKYFSLELRKAYLRIRQLINTEMNKLSGDEQLRLVFEIIKTFENRLQILRITTSSYPESFTIFMTLNSRGMPLGPSDLVKSLFMKNIAHGLSAENVVTKNEEVAAVWKELTDNIGDGDVDQFLRHYLVAKQSEPIVSRVIYRKVEDLVGHDHKTALVNSWNLLKEMKRKSEIYASLLKPETIEEPYIQDKCKTMHQLVDSYRILMMTILDNNSHSPNKLDLLEQRELSHICEVLCIRWVLTGGNAQELEDHLQLVSLSIQDANKDFKVTRDLLASKIPTDSTVRTTFNLDLTKTALIRTVLFGINKLIGDPSELITLDSSKVHVEHIAPATPTDHWKKVLFPDAQGDVTAEYSARIEQWGNKTLLGKRENLDVGQLPFREKCKGRSDANWAGYENTPISITKDLAKESDWSYEVIQQRNQWIAESFIQIWSVHPHMDEVIPFHSWKESKKLK